MSKVPATVTRTVKLKFYDIGFSMSFPDLHGESSFVFRGISDSRRLSGLRNDGLERWADFETGSCVNHG